MCEGVKVKAVELNRIERMDVMNGYGEEMCTH